VQPIADGTARAVQSAQRYTGRDAFLVLNSDNLYPATVLRALVDLDGPGLPAYAVDSLVRDSGFPRDRVMGFAAIEVDDRGHLTRIVEKPGREYYDRVGSRALISMNVWRFDERIFEACRDARHRGAANTSCRKPWASAVSRGEVFRNLPGHGRRPRSVARRSDVSLVNARLRGVEARP
jgi:dTDP-glucose pyrophosphorylase